MNEEENVRIINGKICFFIKKGVYDFVNVNSEAKVIQEQTNQLWQKKVDDLKEAMKKIRKYNPKGNTFIFPVDEYFKCFNLITKHFNNKHEKT